MAIYIFPIFCFGLVITGIVLLGVRQASDLAKQLAAQGNQTEPASDRAQYVPAGRGTAPVKPQTSATHP